MTPSTVNINRKMSELLKKLVEEQTYTAPIGLRIGTVRNGMVYHDCIEIEDAPPAVLELIHDESKEISFVESVRDGKYTLEFVVERA